jgi:hypothetical protein
MPSASAPTGLAVHRLSPPRARVPQHPRLRFALTPRPSTREQAVLTIALLDGVHRSDVGVADPRVAILLRWPAYVVDCVRVRYDGTLHGTPTLDALAELITDLVESENVMGPVPETFG